MEKRQRMCIACRQMSDKKDLKRIVKNSDGQIFVDMTGKANGRGAYICSSKECMQKLKKQKLLNKAFKYAVDEKVYLELEEKVARD